MFVRRAPRFFPPGLLAAFALLVAGADLHAQVTINGRKLPGNRAPANSSALRGASQRPAPSGGAGASSRLAPRGDTVTLPYNMVWGDSQQRLSALFAGVGAKITDKKAEDQKEVWTVEGLIAPDLQTSLFTFSAGQLAAMEFDYSQPAWDLAKYNDKMGLFRRVLETKCGGPGNMISRDTKQEADSPIKESIMGYQWDRGDTTVQLFYFSAEDTAKNLTFRTISVHYHYKDPTLEMYQAMPESVDNGAAADPNSNPLFGGRGGTAGGGKAAPSTAPTPPSPAASASPTPASDAAGGVDTPPGSPPASPSPAESPVAATPSPSPSASPPGKSNPKNKNTPKPPPENDPLPE